MILSALLSSGCTRFPNSIPNIPRCGSIQMLVPVYPVCPYDRAENLCPADDFSADLVSQPSARVSSTTCVVVAPFVVAGAVVRLLGGAG